MSAATRLTRRRFLEAASAAADLAVLGGCAASVKGDVAPKSGRRVVVVGGGWAGATAARCVRLAAGRAAAGPLAAPGYSTSFTCSACHGFAGNSRAETVPILAGMTLYLGVGDVAAYFAAQKREPWRGRVDPAAAARDQIAAAPCAGCHAADGRGDPAKGVPDLRGQPAGYLESQMRLFKADRRSPGDEALTALKALMKTVPDETFADLAAFFASRR